MRLHWQGESQSFFVLLLVLKAVIPIAGDRISIAEIVSMSIRMNQAGTHHELPGLKLLCGFDGNRSAIAPNKLARPVITSQRFTDLQYDTAHKVGSTR